MSLSRGVRLPCSPRLAPGPGRGGQDMRGPRGGQDVRGTRGGQEGRDRPRRGWAGRWLPGRARDGGRGRRRPPQEAVPPGPLAPVLRLSASLAPGQAATLAESVMARVRRAAGPVSGIALDLTRAATDIGWEECAALRALHDRLGATGIRLRLAVANRHLRATLEEEAVVSHIGAGAVHPSLHTALLAFYAELPGPGLVTGSVRDALAQPPEPLDGAAGQVRRDARLRRPAQPWAPLRPGADPEGHLAPGGASPAADGAA